MIRHRRIVRLVAVLAIVLAGCGREERVPEPRPLILAHRGRTAVAPENSVRAVQSALDVGADGVEVDVQATADGDAVIFHDDTLGRVTERQGPVQALTLEELVRIRYLEPGTKKPGGERIASLDAFLDRFGGKCSLFFELKSPGGPGAEDLRGRLVRKVGSAIERRGLETSTLVSSLDRDLIGRLADAHPTVRTVFEFFAPLHELESLPGAIPDAVPGTTWLGPHHDWITPQRVRWAKKHYAGVSTFTPNILEEQVRLMECGVDLIQTDAPRLAVLWRQGTLRDRLRRAVAAADTGWPAVPEGQVHRVRKDGALETTLPPGKVLTVEVAAAGGRANFVHTEIEHLEGVGSDRMAFLVLEQPGPAGPPGVAFRSAPAMLERAARSAGRHLRFLQLRPGSLQLRTTVRVAPSTRSLLIAIGLDGGPHRVRLTRLRTGTVSLD